MLTNETKEKIITITVLHLNFFSLLHKLTVAEIMPIL